MSEKVLTISVAAYNVEKTIRQALDSLCVPEILDQLEVFVIDDGGTDGTLKIAKEYESLYPNTFHAIHKENGGYGSTVNYSIDHATGKYFKLLDGDDWYDSEGLAALVKHLETIDVDLVITPYVVYRERSKKKEKVDICKKRNDGQYILTKKLFSQVDCGMHPYLYKTTLLQSINLRLTKHCFYTDVEYAILPFPYVSSVYVSKKVVYMYRVEVEGQSMSFSEIRKHYKDGEQIFWRLASEYRKLESGSEYKKVYEDILCQQISARIFTLCLLDQTDENLKKLKTFNKQVKKELPEIARTAIRYSKLAFILFISNYTLYPLCSKYCIWKSKRKMGS